MNKILFYRTDEPHGEFSNFSAFSFKLKGKRWPTSEHYFQAQKFADTEHEELIRLTTSPMVAARMGRSRARPFRKDWETVKDEIMYDALRAKFSQNPHILSLLMATENAELVEHTSNDGYWGDAGDGSGRNRLGQLLMKLRDELHAANKQ